MKFSIGTAILVGLFSSLPGVAQVNPANPAKSNAGYSEIKDVETLNDDVDRFTNQKIRVRGKIENKIDARSAVIESGGMVNDEIVVLTSTGMKTNFNDLQENTDVIVTGTLVTKPLADIRRDYSWNLNNEAVERIRSARAFIVADEVVKVVK